MKDMTIFNEGVVNEVSAESLVEQVRIRSREQGITVPDDYSVTAVHGWLKADHENQTYGYPLLTTGGTLTEGGCRIAVMYLPPELLAIMHSDITILFHGVVNTYQMANSAIRITEGDVPPHREFSDIEFLPPGADVEFRFPNGALGISSTYLHKVNQELGATRPHDRIMVKIRKYFSEVEDPRIFGGPLNHSYYGLEEGIYINTQNKEQPHLWMSEDLCLAIAGTEHPVIQRRIIDDLKRRERFLY